MLSHYVVQAGLVYDPPALDSQSSGIISKCHHAWLFDSLSAAAKEEFIFLSRAEDNLRACLGPALEHAAWKNDAGRQAERVLRRLMGGLARSGLREDPVISRHQVLSEVCFSPLCPRSSFLEI